MLALLWIDIPSKLIQEPFDPRPDWLECTRHGIYPSSDGEFSGTRRIIYTHIGLQLIPKEHNKMREPGLDGRHRDKNPPKTGEIQQKRGDTLNRNLPKPIPQFPPDTTLGDMRKATGKVSEEDVRRAAAKTSKGK